MTEEGTDVLHLLVWHSAWRLSFPSDRQETHSTFLGGKKGHCDIFALWWRLSFSYRASDKTKQMTRTSCKYVREGHTQHTLIYIFLFPNETALTLSHSNNRIWSSFKDLSSNLRNLYQKMHFFADCQINAPASIPHSWCGKVFNHSAPPPTVIQLPFS